MENNLNSFHILSRVVKYAEENSGIPSLFYFILFIDNDDT